MYNPSNFWGSLQRGGGCVTSAHGFLKTKATTRSRQILPRNIKLDLSQYLSLCRASHHNTPLHPLSRGETPPLKPFIANKKTASQLSPLERGGGCVMFAHSFLKTKATTRSRQILPRNIKLDLSQYLSLCCTSHRNTPLYPLSRGETSHHKPLITKKKAPSKTSPLERGGGVSRLRTAS